MTGVIFLLIRVIASPVVNVFQKKLTNRGYSPFFIVCIVYVFFSVLALLYLSVKGFGSYSAGFWKYMILLAVTDALGNVFLIRSLKSIDLSVFGPMNAYKPVIALIFSIFLIHEIPSWPGLAGVLIIISGSYFLNLKKEKKSKSFFGFLSSEGIIFRFLSVFFTSVAAVISKKVIIMSSPLVTLSYWSLLGLPVVFMIYRLRKRPGDSSSPLPYFEIGGLFASFLVLQVFSLYTFKFVFVGYSLALFQLSSVISVFFGSKLFREKNIAYRYIASGIMVIGATVIILFG